MSAGAIQNLRLLFMRPDEGNKQILVSGDILHREFIALFYKMLTVFHLRNSGASCGIEGEKSELYSYDYCNLLTDKFSGDADKFLDMLFESAFEYIVKTSGIEGVNGAEGDFVAEKVEAILQGAKEFANGVLKNYSDCLTLSSLKLLKSLQSYEIREVKEKISECDPFLNCRTFLYRGGKFNAINLEDHAKEFFGFEGVRTIFEDHFQKFADSSANGNVPLLISSLPGHGKTQMTIYHALKHEKLTLILAEVETIEKQLPALIQQLGNRQDRKFVIFFDDVVPDDIDWYYFKNYVGGSFVLPENILIVIASNYHFGASLLSRGRSVIFPIFDEIRCMEMVEGFLISCHLKNPGHNLVSIISADYTEYFGQKRFSELSPRTLMRYLDIYRTNINKRKTMMHLAMGDLITKPDSSLFYDFNISLMRKLYGNEYIENLLKEKLRKLEEG
ncbi:MAG: DUF815 domain-containing protein [Lentisphaeria bacterium]|nr:DUF815 domain-containing protein [Lentisphaeria bacterium]